MIMQLKSAKPNGAGVMHLQRRMEYQLSTINYGPSIWTGLGLSAWHGMVCYYGAWSRKYGLHHRTHVGLGAMLESGSLASPSTNNPRVHKDSLVEDTVCGWASSCQKWAKKKKEKETREFINRCMYVCMI